MLSRLIVKDFAIIEDLDITFSNNLTVLTGETGAGKSLIIDTISLLLGQRADSDMIRFGKKEALITGYFDYKEELNDIFKKLGIKIDKLIVIERSITENSKNSIKVNKTSITLNELKQIAKYLADMHIQNDTYHLFEPEKYLMLLDSIAKNDFNKLLDNYSIALMKYNEALKDYNYVLNGINDLNDKLEFYKYEKEELEALELYENMDKDLDEQIYKLSNFDKIQNNLSNSYNQFDNSNLLDSLYEISSNLEKIEDYDINYLDSKTKVLDCYYILNDIKSLIRDQLDSLDYDEEELNRLQEKQNNLSKAMDKYKKNVHELIEYLKDITLKIDMAVNYDDTLKEKKEIVLKTFNELKEKALLISNYRKKLSLSLEKSIVKECYDLDLENTQFEVSFNEVSFTDPFDKSIFMENGVDKIDFLVSFNKGEPKKPLYKVASGGEASRMMLAFKSVFYKASNVELMVFDEIDTGVSGKTALKIANKIHEISLNIQVLCITHLPQVAAKGDYHKHIYKELVDNRTKTIIKDLSKEERIEEIAKMLSGDSLSVYALEHAKELIGIK